MFTIEQIQEIHARVKSGADFPRYVQELKEIGVTGYTIHVDDGRTIYHGKNDFTLISNVQYSPLKVTPKGDQMKLEYALELHQQGLTDFPTFCLQAAEAGAEKWTIDIIKMTCTYYDQQGNLLLAEDIPDKSA